MSNALSAHNLTLATLRPLGGTMVVPAFGRHEGRKVEIQNVTDGTRRFVRATVEGVAIHVPDGTLSDDQIVRLACDQIAA